MSFTLKNLSDLVSLSLQNDASDIHLRSSETPALRIKGEMVGVQSKKLSQTDITDILRILSKTDALFAKLSAMPECDGSFEVENLCRLRFSYFRFMDNCGIVLRIIKNMIPSLEELGISKTVHHVVEKDYGLILVTGPTGSGKNTTLASMIDHLNQTQPLHIITLENPIEYKFTANKSRITQREIGVDTESFTSGLKNALRQDPDVILLGELRTAEEVSIALSAAETGHLVLATLHTSDAVSTISRLISFFAPEQQDEVKMRLATSLYSTIGQRLVKSLAGKLMPIQEIMISNPGITECILGKEPLSKIRDVIERDEHMKVGGAQSFNQAVFKLYKNKQISKEVALANVTSQADFLQKLIVE